MNQDQIHPAIEKILKLPEMLSEILRIGKPVLLYGMGNGAELTSKYLKENGIEPSAVFASDGFVRGQRFMGQEVLSVRGAEEKYGDFVAVLSFALEGEKRQTAYDFAKNHTLFCPSICPFGGVWNRDFVKENAASLSWLYEKLSDLPSRKALIQLLSFAVTGNIAYTHRLPFSVPKEYISHGGIHIDIGAYDGETALEYLQMNGGCQKVNAFEPDSTAFARLKINTSGCAVECVNAAVCDKDGVGGFDAKGSRASALGGNTPVKTVSLDGFYCCRRIGISSGIGSIRIDGEGAEDAILSGSANIIYNDKPAVCAAVYHKANDIIDIPRLLDYQLEGCELYLEVKPYIPAFDVFIYAVKTLR